MHVIRYFIQVLQTSEGILEPLKPFASFPVCIPRITNYLSGTLRHNAFRFIGEVLKSWLQKYNIISYKDRKINPFLTIGKLFLHFSMDFMSDFDMMLQRKKSMSGKRRRNRDGGTFISDADDVVSAMIVKMNEAAEVSYLGSKDTAKSSSILQEIC